MPTKSHPARRSRRAAGVVGAAGFAVMVTTIADGSTEALEVDAGAAFALGASNAGEQQLALNGGALAGSSASTPDAFVQQPPPSDESVSDQPVPDSMADGTEEPDPATTVGEGVEDTTTVPVESSAPTTDPAAPSTSSDTVTTVAETATTIAETTTTAQQTTVAESTATTVAESTTIAQQTTVQQTTTTAQTTTTTAAPTTTTETTSSGS